MGAEIPSVPLVGGHGWGLQALHQPRMDLILIVAFYPLPAFQGPQGLQGRRGPPGLGGTQVNDTAGPVLAQLCLSEGQDPARAC